VTETGGGQTPERFVDDQHRYRLDARIATGGMGEVWRATDTSLGREVAVKVLKNEYADDPTFRSRFETEARHAASLVHPGVASVYDFGEAATDDGSGMPRPYLIMELVDGQPLSALLRGGRPLDPEVVRDLVAQTADALGAAHRAGIVHRDVKPANLLVTPDRRIKITDFGIARASDGLGLTGTGQVMGTPQYLSPEQARGNTATPASDVYSLGVVAFECLVGHRPFDSDSPVATALAHLNDPVPDLPRSVPADLAAVVRRAMAKEPEQRYADGDAFAAALRDPAAAARTAYVPPVVPPVVPPPTQTTQVMRPVPPPVPAGDPAPTHVADHGPSAEDRRRPWLVALLVLAVVAAIVVVVVVVATAGDGNNEPTADHTSRSAPTSSAPTTEDTPSESTSAPAEVSIDEGDYLGRPVDQVASELRAKGLKVDTEPVDNPGDKDADTVASVSPTEGLHEGDTVTVQYYRDAEPSSEPPSSEPTSHSPSSSPTPSPSSSGSPGQQTATPTASASASPAATSSPSSSRSPSPSASTPGSGGTS
jgi:serine/threonine-protein kinase